MSQPGEKLDQVSTHNNGLKKTFGKIVNRLDVMIFFRLKCRIAIEDGEGHRCSSATKMLIPSSRTIKQATSLKDRFRHLRLIEPFNCTFTQNLIGRHTQPTPAKSVFFIQYMHRLRVDVEEGLTFHHTGQTQKGDHQS